MKKGFSLVELAIVLVIIGIVMGMVIKGRSLIHSSKVKAEMVKLHKFRVALGVYYANHGNVPTATSPSGSTLVIVQTIVDAGLLKPSDIDPTYLAAGHTWEFIRMNLLNDTLYQHNSDGILIGAQPATIGTRQGNVVPSALICYMETILDDKNVLGGNGRHIRGSSEFWSYYSSDPLKQYYVSNKCMEANSYKFVSYAYAILQ